jgi:hypothetical protein
MLLRRCSGDGAQGIEKSTRKGSDQNFMHTGVIQLFSHLQNASLNALSTVKTLLTGKCKGKCIALTIYGNPDTFSSAFSLSGKF